MSRRSGASATASPTLFGGILAVLVGVLILAGLSEVILRIAMPNWREYYSGWFMTSLRVPGLAPVSIGVANFDGYFSQNNGDFRSHIRINAFGLRNDEPVSAAQGRLWVIGDSMSFGWGVDRSEAYTQVIADVTGMSTYNVAGPGSDVCGWQTLYARMPSDVRPRSVVVGLTVENRMSVYDCEAARAEASRNELIHQDAMDLIAVKRWLTKSFALYNFFAVSLKRVNVIEWALEKIGLIKDPGALLLHGQDPARSKDMIRTTADELAVLKASVPPGTPFVVAIFPARFELEDGNTYFRDLRTGVGAALAERDVDTIDLLEPFKSVAMASTHFAHDGHWSAAGHKLAGEAIARWLVDRGLVGADSDRRR